VPGFGQLIRNAKQLSSAARKSGRLEAMPLDRAREAAIEQGLLPQGASIRDLLDLADRLEIDLKTCRSGLQQAHAVMSLNPDLPAASEKDARHAVDAGLRALLQQRLWIRDRSPAASQHELDETASSMREARDRLQPLLKALAQAQTELNSAMREQIRRDSDH